MRSLVQAIILLSLSAQSYAGMVAPVITSVPALSEWGMLSLGTAIVSAGLYLIRKNRK
ncbi:MAG: IPTL-CTERM sorting domain-containing protein [Betaproteobacteria bacterium]|nr:IPTL-CTERM sorting domain-containing protein [Betaproteobacteria bacterium]